MSMFRRDVFLKMLLVNCMLCSTDANKEVKFLGDTYVTKSGYIEVAELNNIILIFPQVIKELVNNPNGCFDWWGYTGMLKYAKKDGVQNNWY
ncbi:hypothetical protein Avbf_14977 [Armadillidium vulgare]|nr:hypothetical protein Avbf_14977 [Armadillidium vulgare]